MQRLDFVRDVRNDLDGFAEKLAATFFLNDLEINLTGGVVRLPCQRSVRKSLVVAQIQIRFAAVVQHIDFAMLVGAHGSRIDVDVRIELLHPDPQSPAVPATFRSMHWSILCQAN